MTERRHKPKRMTGDEDRAFAALWARGMRAADLVETFGLGRGDAAYAVAKRLGLPPRRLARGAVATADVVPPPEAGITVPKLPPHPYWDALKDLAVMQTGGRHREVDALAAELGKPRIAVVQRFHQLRAG